MARRLRIAAAGFFVVLAVGFVALWVRSYWQLEILEQRTGVWGVQLSSVKGRIALAHLDPGTTIGRSYLSVEAGDAAEWRKGGALGFALYDDSLVTALVAPHWLPALLSASLAALLAFNRTWRFTVRGLLIGTTVVAAALGLAVWAV